MKKMSPLFTIFLIVFIDLLGFGIILPLLPFIGEKYGANPLEIGLLTAVYSFFQLVSAPILGRLSDRYGRKKLLVVSQVGTALGFFMLAFSNNIWLIFLSRIIDGITGGNISIAQAYIADVTTRENRAKGMGLIGAAFGMGFIFGPALGGILSRWGFGVPALFAAIISICSVLATIFFLKETVKVKEAIHSKRTSFSIKELKYALSLYPLGLMIVTFFILNFAFTAMQSIFPLWTQTTYGFGPTKNGLLFAYIGILIVIIQLKVLPFMLKRMSEERLLKIALLSLSIGLVMIPLSIHPNLIFIALMFTAFGNGLSNPLIQSIASESVPKEDYGGTLGLLQSSGSFGRIAGPIAGGEIYSTLGKNSPMLSAGTLTFLFSLFLQKKLKETKNNK